MQSNKIEQLKNLLSQSSQEDITQSLKETGFFQRLGEEIPKQIAKDAKLLNFPLSTIVEFRGSQALYIPVAVSDTREGRPTVYNLPIGQKTLMGIYVQDNRIYQEFFNRIDDSTYDVTVSTLTDRIVYSGQGKLEKIDERVGYGKLRTIESEIAKEKPLANSEKKTTGIPDDKWSVWALWSCLKVEKD